MAGASLFLPFLPLLPKQILLTNLLTDFPEMTIATDSVDRELVNEPRRWDIGFIRNFMLTFGLLSSVFDYLTFGVLLLVLKASEAQFRTGWFVESVISAPDRAGHPHPPAVLPEPAREIPGGSPPLFVGLLVILLPYSPHRRPAGLHAAAAALPGRAGPDRGRCTSRWRSWRRRSSIAS